MRFTEVNVKDDIIISEYYNKRISLSFKETKKPIRFQIPRMYMPFGISGFIPEIGPTKWNADFSMSGWNEENNYIKKFYNFLKEIETLVIDYVKENSLEIFGMVIDPKNINNMFNSNIKEGGNYDPKFRVKVDTDSHSIIKPHIFDIHENNITGEVSKGLYKGYTGVSVVELTSVYFLNKKFGLTWKMYQMKVYEPQRLHGFQFIEDPDDGEEEDDKKISGFQFQI